MVAHTRTADKDTYMFMFVMFLVALVVVLRGFVFPGGQRRHLRLLYLSRCLQIAGHAARGAHQTMSARVDRGALVGSVALVDTCTIAN